MKRPVSIYLKASPRILFEGPVNDVVNL